MADTFDWEKPLFGNRRLTPLITALADLRTRLKKILSGISDYLPGLTDHSIAHVDELRALTDRFLVVDRKGKGLNTRNSGDRKLSAAEVYCLNVAYLIHDACLSPLVHPGEVKGIRNSDEYRRLCIQDLRAAGTPVTNARLEKFRSVDPKEDPIFFGTLRNIHGESATRLIEDFCRSAKQEAESLGDDHANSKQRGGGDCMYLIDNQELRRVTSELVGPIAASHARSAESLESLSDHDAFPSLDGLRFRRGEGRIRPRYLALILRVVDACQIDSSRALIWSRLLQQPSGESASHWDFQQGLRLVDPEEDALRFKLSGPLDVQRAGVWWKAYKYVNEVVHREMEAANRLLDKWDYPRFKVSRVEGGATPGEFKKVNATEGWEPIDVRPTIRDPLRIIRSIGGSVLYGKDPLVPIREVIQNALDASDALDSVRARSEKAPVEITVDRRGRSIAVRDFGIGMSRYVLTNILPDFGRSIWSHYDPAANVGDFFAEDLKPRGKYGIGFYSIFMISDQVRISTMSYKEPEAWVLEFQEGLEQRPILRKPSQEEHMARCGTEVRFKLKADDSVFGGSWVVGRPVDLDFLLGRPEEFVSLIKLIAPLANRQITVKFAPGGDETADDETEPRTETEESAHIIESVSFRELSNNPSEFRQRIHGTSPFENSESEFEFPNNDVLFENLQEVVSETGESIGLIAPAVLGSELVSIGVPSGVVVDGGLRVASSSNFSGVCNGIVTKADRLSARSLLSEASRDSIEDFVAHYKRVFFKNGKPDGRLKEPFKSLRIGFVSELAFLDPEFLQVLYSSKQSNPKAKARYSRPPAWISDFNRSRRLIFFLPIPDREVRDANLKVLKYAHPILDLLLWAKVPSLAAEGLIDDPSGASLAHVFRSYLQRVAKRGSKKGGGQQEAGKGTEEFKVDMQFGKFTIGNWVLGHNKMLPYEAFGLMFFDPNRHSPNQAITLDSGDLEQLALIGKGADDLAEGVSFRDDKPESGDRAAPSD